MYIGVHTVSFRFLYRSLHTYYCSALKTGQSLNDLVQAETNKYAMRMEDVWSRLVLSDHSTPGPVFGLSVKPLSPKATTLALHRLAARQLSAHAYRVRFIT